MNQPAPVYLDCDTGIDDALALTYLLHSSKVRLVGIGTVSGNTSSQEAAANTQSLLRAHGSSVPVAVGCRDPLGGSYRGGAPHVHGTNGIGDVSLPAGDDVTSEGAPEMLLRLAREHGTDLDIVAIGPLTNLAHALSLDPTLPRRVGTLTIMGGAVWAPGNITGSAEANLFNDAEAARQVLAAGFTTVLVPLDVTVAHCFDDGDAEAFTRAGTSLHVALGAMLHRYIDFYESVDHVRRAPLHDPLAAAIAVGDIETVTRETALAVTLDGPEQGRTVAVADGPTVQVVVGAGQDTADIIRGGILAAGPSAGR
ncbi:nucleoside hydrolase [Serinibacter arcticus]|uniref:Nucleoside hydrolase n=1 Tax=Serinibacter arcticus TaxID=1655435 RepID=A0A2U1ZTP9_9MICO|nr:nucleoside hydrolase [Serinibacter arcticus]PWD50302.1 nucleoside hydrolase [Serinibacter arcticus]